MIKLDRARLHKVLLGIVSFGLALDCFSTFKIWNTFSGSEEIFKLIDEFGQGYIDREIVETLLAEVALPVGIMLMVFLVWDFLAYLFLLKFKNWSRRYVLSISFFYLFSCLFSFSFIQFIYGTITTIVLFKYGDFFKEKTNT